jgi:hypothetical protein
MPIKPTLVSIACTFVLSAFCYAPILDKPPDAKFYPETTQEVVAEQQKYQGTIGEVGQTPLRTDVPEGAQGGQGGDAAAAMSAANRHQSEHALAAQTLLAAEQNVRGGASASPIRFVWPVLFLGVGFAIVMGVRSYVSRKIPEMPKPKKMSW